MVIIMQNSMRISRDFVKALTTSARLLSILTFLSIFGYWSGLAFLKFQSKPISTTVSFTQGDDGRGNIGEYKWEYWSSNVNSRYFLDDHLHFQSFQSSQFVWTLLKSFTKVQMDPCMINVLIPLKMVHGLLNFTILC